MNDKRGCPLFKYADVEVQVMCPRCGHYDIKSTACHYRIDEQLVKMGHMKQKDFDDKHADMGIPQEVR